MDRLTQFASFLSSALALAVRVDAFVVSAMRGMCSCASVDAPLSPQTSNHSPLSFIYSYFPGNALVSSYSANALNQYTQRTVPGYAAVRGEAATNATITINERPVWRSGSYFYGGDSADNTASAVYKDLEIYAAVNPPGTNTPDTVYAETNHVFVVQTPEQFTYDADGNMTSDGRFHYTWNGENRLVMASNDTSIVTYANVLRHLRHQSSLFLGLHLKYFSRRWKLMPEKMTFSYKKL